MKRLTLLFFVFLFLPVSLAWAQEDMEEITRDDGLMVNAADYGLIFEEPDTSRNLEQMPIYRPGDYTDKDFIWTPPDKWFYDMPVIEDPCQDSLRPKDDK